MAHRPSLASRQAFPRQARRPSQVGPRLAPRPAVPGWPAILAEFLAARRRGSPFTLRFYRNNLTPFVAWLAAQKIAPEAVRSRDIVAYQNLRMDDGLKPRSLHAVSRALRAFLRYAAREEYITMPHLDMPSIPPDDPDDDSLFLASGAIDRMLRACRGRLVLRDTALLHVLASTGLRRKEVAGLRWRDISLDGGGGTGRVHVTAVTAKSKRPRVAYLGPEARNALARYRDARYRNTPPHAPDDPVFPGSVRGGVLHPLTASAISQIVTRIGARARVKNAHPHAFRHTAARQLLASGLTITEVQRILGHSSILITERYVSATNAQTEASFVRLHGENGRKKRAA